MKFNFKLTPWAIVSTYAIGNSFIYSWTFWNKFKINILQFASFSDLLPSILYTLIIPIITALVGLYSSMLWKALINKIDSFVLNIFPSWHVRHELLTRILITSSLSITFIIIALTTGILQNSILESSNTPFKEILYICITIVASVFAAFIFESKTKLLSEFKILRRILIFTFFISPSASYNFAIFNANNIINGKDTFIVSTDSKCSNNPSEQYRYISSISDKAFSLSLQDGAICVFNYNYLKLTPEISKRFEAKFETNAI